MAKTLKTVTPARGYAWLCDFGLCRWAEPSREQLTAKSKPSPEAKPVAVYIVPRAEYLRLKKQQKCFSTIPSATSTLPRGRYPMTDKEVGKLWRSALQYPSVYPYVSDLIRKLIEQRATYSKVTEEEAARDFGIENYYD